MIQLGEFVLQVIQVGELFTSVSDGRVFLQGIQVGKFFTSDSGWRAV